MDKRGLFALLMGMKTGAATVERGIEIPQKLKMDLPFDQVIPRNISEETPNTNLKEHK